MWRWLVPLAALCCLSCSRGPELNPVQGKVLYKNQPLGGVVVTFHPKGANDVTTIRPIGRTSDDGTFTLMTGQKEGASAGEYTVTLICPEELPKKGISTAPPESQDKFKGAYADPGKSTLKVEIKKGPNTLEPFSLQ
jgi:hypothetical protein